mmetsp:Transcript_61727/g.180365  ORF Transcript_61727/g.180365 Transcript_61727/m.180365 type:complete len:341 (+) Transcript_61727:593-1615(+)
MEGRWLLPRQRPDLEGMSQHTLCQLLLRRFSTPRSHLPLLYLHSARMAVASRRWGCRQPLTARTPRMRPARARTISRIAKRSRCKACSYLRSCTTPATASTCPTLGHLSQSTAWKARPPCQAARVWAPVTLRRAWSLRCPAQCQPIRLCRDRLQTWQPMRVLRKGGGSSRSVGRSPRREAAVAEAAIARAVTRTRHRDDLEVPRLSMPSAPSAGLQQRQQPVAILAPAAELTRAAAGQAAAAWQSSVVRQWPRARRAGRRHAPPTPRSCSGTSQTSTLGRCSSSSSVSTSMESLTSCTYLSTSRISATWVMPLSTSARRRHARSLSKTSMAWTFANASPA